MPSINSSLVDAADPNSFVSPFTDRTPVAFYSSIPTLGNKAKQGCLVCALTELSRARVAELKYAQSVGSSSPFSSPLFDVAPEFGVITTPEIPTVQVPDPDPPAPPPPYPEEITPPDGSIINIHRGLIIHCIAPALSACQQSVGLILVNPSVIGIDVIVDGASPGFGVDDDVLFDGVTYEDNEHVYWSGGSPCWGMAHRNGAHNFYFTKRIGPLRSLVVQVRDNGFGGTGTSMRCDITFP